MGIGSSIQPKTERSKLLGADSWRSVPFRRAQIGDEWASPRTVFDVYTWSEIARLKLSRACLSFSDFFGCSFLRLSNFDLFGVRFNRLRRKEGKGIRRNIIFFSALSFLLGTYFRHTSRFRAKQLWPFSERPFQTHAPEKKETRWHKHVALKKKNMRKKQMRA